MSHKRRGLWGLSIAVLLAVAGYLYWYLTGTFETTDNAYLNAHVYHIGAQVSGQIKAMHVADGQRVQKGTLLLEIDPEPFLIAVERAEAQLERARFMAQRNIALYAEASSLVHRSEADLRQAQLDHQRAEALAATHLISREQADTARTRVQVARAALASARARMAAEKANLGEQGKQNELIRDATAALEQAKYELRNCKILAPTSGQITKLVARPGDLVARTQTLFMIVDDSDFWIDANFKEKQLTYISVGAEAEVSVDMYPGRVFRGQVESIGSGSTTAFSLLPSQNATGNWVKIEQRVPVKVKIVEKSPQLTFRIGTSSAVRIKTQRLQ